MSKGKKQFQLSKSLTKSIKQVLSLANWLGSAVIVALVFLAKCAWEIITWAVSSLFYLILRVLKKDFKKHRAKSYRRGSGRLTDNLKNGSFLGLAKFLPAQAARRKLLPGLVVILVFLVGFAVYKSRQATDARAGWFNDRWGYRKKVTITNGSGGELTDFQVEVTLDTASLITAGKMQSDCDDLRITDINGKILPHLLDSAPGCNNSSTSIWTKLTSIPTTDTTLYVYYGNPSINSTSSGQSVLKNGGLWLTQWTDGHTIHPADEVGMDTLFSAVNYSGRDGWDAQTQVNCTNNACNLFGVDTSYLTLLEGWIFTPEDGTYTFAVDGDDAIEIQIDGVNWKDNIGGTNVANWYNGHGLSGGWTHSGTINLTTGFHRFIFRHEEYAGGDSWLAGWQKPSDSSTTLMPASTFYYRKHADSVSIGSPAAEEVGPGPVAYWKFDEGYGMTAEDYTSNNHNGTLASGPSWQNEDMCISGKCLGFDGADDYVNIGTGNNYFPLPLFSICTWIRTPGLGSGMTKAGILSITYGLGFGLNGSGNFDTYMDNGSSSPHAIITQNLFDNKFHHLCLTYDGVDRHMYIDGIKRLTQATTWLGTTRWPTNGASIGHDANNPPVYKFNGFIDEAKIYPYARTADEVKADYIAGATSAGSSAVIGSAPETGGQFSEGLVGYWKMDESSSPSLDYSGRGYSATWTGDAAASSGKYGGGITQSDGGNGYLSVSDTDDPFDMGTNNFSIAMWAKLDSVSSPGAPELLDKMLSATTGYHLRVGYNAEVEFQIKGTSGSVEANSANSAITAGLWYHITAVYDNNNGHKIYINGSQSGSTITGDAGNIDNTDSLRIGVGFNSWEMDGTYDEVRIYNRALSPREVQDLYNWAPGPYVYLNFDEGTGTSINDRSGNGYSGTWNGSGAHWTEGKFGGGAVFDGSSDYVSFSSLPKPTNLPITIEFWTKPSTSTPVGIFDSAPGVGDVLRNYSAGKVEWWASAPIITLGLTANQWSHLAFTFSYSGGNQYIEWYKNGAKQTTGSAAGDGAWAWTTFRLGNINSGSAGWYSGDLDEFKIYNYARTPAQIIEDMNAGHPIGGSPIGSQLAYWKFDEGYGTTANNSGFTGSTLNGSLTGTTSPTWTNNGKIGKALSFDGNDDYVRLENDIDSSQITITAWINPSTPVDFYGPIFTNLNHSNNSGYAFMFGSASLSNLRFYVGDESIAESSNITAGNWYHLAATWDGSDASIYIDGELVEQGSLGTPAGYDDSNEDIGQYAGSYNYNGILDEVKIYSAALTADQIKLDYNFGKSINFGTGTVENQDQVTSGRTLYLDATDKNSYPGSGTIWYDLSGNARNASLSSPTWNGLKFTNTAATLTNLGTSIYPSVSTNTTILWVYPEEGGGSAWLVTPQDVHTYMSYSGNSSAYINTWDNGSSQRTIWNVTESIPHQIVITKNGSVRTTYDNLIQKGQVTLTDPAPSVNSNIVYGSAGLPMGLSIVETYNRVLSTEEITQDYVAHASKFGLDPGPVAEWKFDEKTGTTVNDTSGNGNTGTLINMESVDWKSSALCKVGACLDFDGDSEYVNFSNASVVNPTSGSIEAWINASNWDANRMTVFSSEIGPGWVDLRFVLFSNSDNSLTFSVANGTSSTTDSCNTGTVLSANTWYHITGTYDGNYVKIYVNGILKDSYPSSITPGIFTPTKTMVGWHYSNRYWNGKIDHVRIYDYARTPAQIAWDYNRGAPVGWWKLDKGEGLTAYDSSGNENNGTLQASMTNDDWVTGKINASLDFDGTDDYVSLNADIFDVGTGDFTMALWTKVAVADTNDRLFSVGNSNHYELWVTSDGLAHAYGGDSSSSRVNAASNNSIEDDTWHHVVGVYDRDYAIKLYIDGVLQDDIETGYSSYSSVDYNLTSARIGNYVGGSSYGPQARIDDVRIYNYALTENQIKNLYNDDSAIRFSGE